MSTGGYGLPPFGTAPTYGPPSNSQQQSLPQEFDIDNGTFKIKMVTPIWNERGASARAIFYAEHYLDGVITSYTSALAVGFLDKNGNALLASYFTAGAVTPDPSQSGTYYVYIMINTNAPEGTYLIEWTGTYTPKAGGPALNLRFRRAFKVQATKAPSQWYFLGTDQ